METGLEEAALSWRTEPRRRPGDAPGSHSGDEDQRELVTFDSSLMLHCSLDGCPHYCLSLFIVKHILQPMSSFLTLNIAFLFVIASDYIYSTMVLPSVLFSFIIAAVRVSFMS